MVKVKATNKRVKQKPLKESEEQKETRGKTEKKKNRSKITNTSEEEQIYPSTSPEETVRLLSEKINITGRETETKHILNFIFNSPDKILYIYGRPGTGKSFTLSQIIQALEIPVYFSNLLIDKQKTQKNAYCNQKNSQITENKPALLVLDEFEGNTKYKIYYNLISKLKNKNANIKSILISNTKHKEGLEFKVYKIETIKKIVSENSFNFNLNKLYTQVLEGVEKGDLRVSLNKKITIKQTNVQETEFNNIYHNFIKRTLIENNNDINKVYSLFIAEMIRLNVPVVNKEIFREIAEIYTQGTE
ncbi:hypothetical protein NEOKW01_0623 [Nematocida sp. AWRm80]|nr:hypothetical protein NEOKW01_0623 [Nematocida sp. AWRm80]